MNDTFLDVGGGWMLTRWEIFVTGVSGMVILAAAWVGHAYWLLGVLNNLYARPIAKPVLRLVRAATGLLILAFPVLPLLVASEPTLGLLFGPYISVCALIGGAWFPFVTASRLLRPRPKCVRVEASEIVDFGPGLGAVAAAGDGKWAFALRRVPLSLHDAYKLETTDLTLAVPGLPPAWDGLRILLLSDLHFCGTPSREWFDAVFDRLTARPAPDLVVLAGDFVDTDRHHAWIGPLLGRLKWTEHGLAILGNHDDHHDPELLRKELSAAGYQVLGNGWKELTIRGERCVAIGHEGPWIGPPPDLKGLPTGVFRLCVSHTPDNFPWGVAAAMNLMLCGHVHGGQIRVPVIGSIFVPSKFGRKYDMGVFEADRTVMVVNRGLSGKEPFRFRCPPQVLWLTLTPG